MIGERAVVTGGNLLLAKFPARALDLLEPDFRVVDLINKEVIHAPYAAIEELYFPISGVISWLVTMQDGDMAEAITIGREGVAGISVVLGHRSSTTAIVQAPGQALVIDAQRFTSVYHENSDVSRIMHRYTNAVLNVMAQCAACNRLHDVTERCARWLLMMHDRADGDEFTLVQEFLADMLGVRRPSVSVCASILQRAGLISYKRGKVRITDRTGLEHASCECYSVIAKEYATFLSSA